MKKLSILLACASVLSCYAKDQVEFTVKGAPGATFPKFVQKESEDFYDAAAKFLKKNPLAEEIISTKRVQNQGLTSFTELSVSVKDNKMHISNTHNYFDSNTGSRGRTKITDMKKLDAEDFLYNRKKHLFGNKYNFRTMGALLLPASLIAAATYSDRGKEYRAAVRSRFSDVTSRFSDFFYKKDITQ